MPLNAVITPLNNEISIKETDIKNTFKYSLNPQCFVYIFNVNAFLQRQLRKQTKTEWSVLICLLGDIQFSLKTCDAPLLGLYF